MSHVDDIIEAIREIRKNGEKLPSERDLAERLNVKRHQLRKALATLRESGDLAPPAPRRARASVLTQYSEELVGLTNPLEVLEVRLLLEPGYARLASLRASLHDIRRITDAATTPEGAMPGAVDLAFHLAVAEAARNHLAGAFYRMLREVGVDARLRVASTDNPACPKRIGMRDAEHRRIAEAIARRDPDAAETAMRAHLQSVQRLIDAYSTVASTAA